MALEVRAHARWVLGAGYLIPCFLFCIPPTIFCYLLLSAAALRSAQFLACFNGLLLVFRL
jgi:hypothetical protein